MPTPPAQAQLVVTIMPDGTMFVSLRGADRMPTPARAVVLDNRLESFVAEMQALARRKLAALESSTERRAPNGDPAIAGEAAHSEEVR